MRAIRQWRNQCGIFCRLVQLLLVIPMVSCKDPTNVVHINNDESESFDTVLFRISHKCIEDAWISEQCPRGEFERGKRTFQRIGFRRQSVLIFQNVNKDFLIVDGESGSKHFESFQEFQTSERFQGSLLPRLENRGDNWIFSDGRVLKGIDPGSSFLIDVNQRYLANTRRISSSFGNAVFDVMELTGKLVLCGEEGVPIQMESDENGLWILRAFKNDEAPDKLPYSLLKYRATGDSLNKEDTVFIRRPDGVQSAAEFDALDFCPTRNQIVFLEHFIGFSAGPFSKTHVWIFDIKTDTFVSRVMVPGNTSNVFFASKCLASRLDTLLR